MAAGRGRIAAPPPGGGACCPAARARRPLPARAAPAPAPPQAPSPDGQQQQQPPPQQQQQRQAPPPVYLEDAATAAFLAWARGAGAAFERLRPATFGGLRGLAAAAPIKADDLIVSVPRAAALTLPPRQRCPCPDYVTPEFWDGAPWFARLGVALLAERRKGGASRLGPYIQQLPRDVGAPVGWPDERLQQLQYPYLIQKARARGGRRRAGALVCCRSFKRAACAMACACAGAWGRGDGVARLLRRGSEHSAGRARASASRAPGPGRAQLAVPGRLPPSACRSPSSSRSGPRCTSACAPPWRPARRRRRAPTFSGRCRSCAAAPSPAPTSPAL
jgi:hypothetical protein